MEGQERSPSLIIIQICLLAFFNELQVKVSTFAPERKRLFVSPTLYNTTIPYFGGSANIKSKVLIIGAE